MTERVLGPTGSPRRRWTLLLPLVAMIALGLFYVAGAQAVHDETFQLDGDVLASTTTTVPPGPNPPAETQLIDWDSMFNADGSTKASLPNGFEDANLERDFNTSPANAFLTNDGTTFSTGSKDTLPISGWQCNLDNNVNSKIDVMNGYAATYTAASDDEILYFGIERNVNTGDANVGFWFLQDEVACVSTGPSVTFTGEHRDGDLLVVSEFSNGGLVSTINVYRWDRPDPALPGSLNTTPVADGVDCRSGTTSVNDEACGAANQDDINTPWLTAAKTTVGNSLPEAQFFEGGVNLTQSNLGGRCFNTFLADTRSSTSLTATLFDFVGGQLGSCETTLTTTAALNASGATINNGNTAANGTVSSGIDNADLDITGVDEWGGTLKFYLCGPFASGLCTSGGVLISTVNVSDATTQPIPSGDGTTTGFATLTSAGRYCWFAEFTPDADTAAAGVSGDTDDGSGSTPNTECFTVAAVTPTLDTLAGTSPVDLGQAVTDAATLSGAAKEPGSNGANTTYPTINATNGAFVGTIGFTLKGVDGLNPATVPADCSTTNALPFAGETQTFPINVTVTGNTTYSGVSFKPSAPGAYHWVATYSHTAATVNNNLPVTHNATCQDGDEAVTIRQIPTEIATAPFTYPQDSASIKSSVAGDNLPAGGTVVFKLFGATNGTSALTNCTNGAAVTSVGTGGLRYIETKTNVVPAGGANEVTGITTNNTAFPVNPNNNGTYYWRVTYAPGDTAHTGRQSACVESTLVTQTGDAGTGTVFP